MGARPDDRMIPVELIDDDDAAASTSPRSPMSAATVTDAVDDRATPPAHPNGGLARWAVAGVALVALAVVSVATTRGTTDEPAGPGVLAEPLREVWAAAADDVLAIHEGIVVVQSTGTHEPRVRALDRDDGREIWSVPLGSAGPADVCTPGAAGTPATVWCWRTPRWDPDPESGELAISADALVGLDAMTGAVVAERDVVEPSAGWSVEGDDLVLAVPQDGAMRLDRVSPTGWRTLWSTTVPMAPEPRGLRHDAWVEVVDGLAVVHGPTTAVVDAADGRVLATWTATEQEESSVLDGAEVVVTPQGFAVWSKAVDGTRLPEAVWYDRTGEAVGGFVGDLAEPRDGDGSVPEVLLVTPDEGATLVAVAVDGGTELWRLPLAGGVIVARRDSSVVVATGDTVASYETLTGIRRWTRPVDGLHPELAGVSEQSTLVVTAVRDRHWTALAYRLVDGGLLWSAVIPGTDELGLIPYPPTLTTVEGTPVVWVGRTLVWVDG